jgi:Na+-transporting NADH:ubiquinone oxidoreductase subunit NqrA
MTNGIALKNVCLTCGNRRATVGNHCDACAAEKYVMTPTRVGAYLDQAGAFFSPAQMAQLRVIRERYEIMDPHLIAVAMIVRALIVGQMKTTATTLTAMPVIDNALALESENA